MTPAYNNMRTIRNIQAGVAITDYNTSATPRRGNLFVTLYSSTFLHFYAFQKWKYFEKVANPNLNYWYWYVLLWNILICVQIVTSYRSSYNTGHILLCFGSTCIHCLMHDMWYTRIMVCILCNDKSSSPTNKQIVVTRHHISDVTQQVNHSDTQITTNRTNISDDTFQLLSTATTSSSLYFTITIIHYYYW